MHCERTHTVTDSKRKVLLAPSSTDCVDITSTNTTAFNLDVDIVVTEGLGLELVLVELEPRLGSIDLEALELLGVRHVGKVVMYGGVVSVQCFGRNRDSKQNNTRSSEGYQKMFILLASQADEGRPP
jgi:hypothetical protein